MASKINADEFVDREGEGKPTLPKGVVLSGVTTITTAVVAENEVANSTGINAGIITSTHFAGNLTGDVNAGIVTVTSQTVVGSAVTISASGIDIGAGVITATSYVGSGANLTGIGATIMVWEYNPDPYDTAVTLDTGIGITFNQKIKAGSGNITLSIANAGVAGTVVENFGIGNSVTITNNSLSFTPTSNLTATRDYCVTLPSGVITNMAGESYVGTAYTFQARTYNYELWSWGYNLYGELGHNQSGSNARLSSPVQVPGSWNRIVQDTYGPTLASKPDGTLWSWGRNNYGQLGQNDGVSRSSPVQIPGTTWSGDKWKFDNTHSEAAYAIKTDGTLWSWGRNFTNTNHGALGLNDIIHRSSPTQIGSGTDWNLISGGYWCGAAIKTDGTLWTWGINQYGQLGQNQPYNINYSSPVQVPGTTWSEVSVNGQSIMGIKTNGTLWTWGRADWGQLGQNAPTTSHLSSPVQVPGTTWSKLQEPSGGQPLAQIAIKTDGTLWSWGYGGYGKFSQNTTPMFRSSPIQIPGTTWDTCAQGVYSQGGIKTDSTLWIWGYNANGQLGQNNRTDYSSAVQIPGTTWYSASFADASSAAIKRI